MRTTKSYRAPIIEASALEARRLFSIVIQGQDLVITTGAGNDTIFLSQDFRKVKAVVNGKTTIKDPSDDFFDRIVINAGKGNDKIEIDESVDIRATLNGEAGNDNIQSYGSGGDVFVGGSGTDTISFEKLQSFGYISTNGVRDDGNGVGNDNVGADFEIFVGGESDDRILVSDIANATVFGGDGNDTIAGGQNGDVFGEQGFDLLLASDSKGANNYSGGADDDTINYLFRKNPLSLSLDGSHNDGEAGEKDFLSHDIESVFGGAGNDTITGDNFDNFLDGFSGNDTIDGKEGFNTLRGSIGNDVLVGGHKSDEFQGGSGTDFVTYFSRTENLSLLLKPTGVIVGGASGEHDEIDDDVENITGGQGNDTIEGNAGDNFLAGAKGNDLLRGGAGADTFVGGIGNDTVTYSEKGKGVKVSLDGINNDGVTGEKDKVTDDVENINGTPFNDILQGNNNKNFLAGDAGDDLLNGMGDNDILRGDAGNDTYIGGAGIDIVTFGLVSAPMKISVGDGANDGVAGEKDDVTVSIESVFGGSGNDTFIGNVDSNGFFGAGGDDTFVASGGNDTMVGNDGNDTADFSSRNSNLNLSLDGVANDGFVGATGNLLSIENIIGGSGNDTITGNDSPNNIDGGGGNDSINGAGGNDTIHGGGGKDTLLGGSGQDQLFGDGSNDKFKTQDGEKDSVTGGSGTDSILDKDNNDVIGGVP